MKVCSRCLEIFEPRTVNQGRICQKCKNKWTKEYRAGLRSAGIVFDAHWKKSIGSNVELRRRNREAWFSGKTCEKCGSVENLQAHHVNPKEKIRMELWLTSDSRREAELAKCIPVCAPCHRKIHQSPEYRSFRLRGRENVHWDGSCDRWRVRFVVNGRRMGIGGKFRNPLTARMAAESFNRTLERQSAEQFT